MTAASAPAPLAATYRLQINRDFTFADAAAIVPYLHRLGISHLYLSPVFEAVPGSNHGYDVLDPTIISHERGGENGLRDLDETLAACDPPLGLILDIVPNHMAASGDNPFWRDVLAHGPSSAYYSFFALYTDAAEPIPLPVLGENLEDIIRRGDHEISKDKDGKWQLRLWEKTFPLRDDSLHGVSDPAALPPDRLLAVLAAQHYRLVPWQDIFKNLPYRRFFDITDLIGLRVEDEKVYAKTHEKIIALAASLKSFSGVRVDHVDGLHDPAAYLEKLAQDIPRIWVEKILSPGETLPAAWPVQGTTGYEFMDNLNRTLVAPAGFAAIESWWRCNIETTWTDFADCVDQAKADMLHTLFPAEHDRLVARTPGNGDEDSKRLFWTGLSVALPVYRTYATESTLSPDDSMQIEKAARHAQDIYGPAFESAYAQHASFLKPSALLQAWQQLSGPLMAKGLEDTAHYRYTPLACLNEVGCHADMTESGSENFFRRMRTQQTDCPHTLKATSTHDNKRAEDVRARLCALSHYPQQWLAYVEEARRINSHIRPRISTADEYLLYQTLIGTWPFDSVIDETYGNRMADYMRKAAREAKRETNWLSPDPAYEDALRAFTMNILGHRPFTNATKKLSRTIARAGALLSLNMLTLKILTPGVPDFYQGNELWDFSLVDPDNRRPINYSLRQDMLHDLERREQDEGRPALLHSLCTDWQDGRIKLWLTRTLLHARRHLLETTGPDWTIQMTEPPAAGFLSYRLCGPDRKTCLSVTLATTPTLLANGRGLFLQQDIAPHLCPGFPVSFEMVRAEENGGGGRI